MILSFEQRLNLLVLLGSLECKTLNETRGIWKLMDRLELTDEQKQLVEYKVTRGPGGDMFAWNNDKAPNAVAFEFSDAEMGHIERAVKSCPRWIPAAARRWLAPLLDQMPASYDVGLEPEPRMPAPRVNAKPQEFYQHVEGSENAT